jgi:hypothetical protein
VKKNPFTTVGQIKNTLQEGGVSVSKSTIKRRLHQSKCRRFTTRCKSLVSLKNRKTRLEFAKKTSKKSLYSSRTISYGQMRQISTCTRMMGREEYGEGNHGGGSVMAWPCMAANGTGSLVFIDDVSSEVFWAILSAPIQPNASKLIGRRFTVQMDNDPKAYCEYFFKAKKWNVLQWSS